MRASHGYIIVLTEKPEVGTAIANALFTNIQRTKEKGFRSAIWDGSDVLLIDLEGNPFTLEQPQEINPRLKSWGNVRDLLPIPSWPQSVPAKGNKTFLNKIKSAAKKSSRFIVATDSDLEGEAIGVDVAFFCNIHHSSERVLLNSSLTKPDIIKAFQNLTALSESAPKYYAAQAKRVSDWYWMYLVRAHTYLARNGKLGKGLDISNKPEKVISSGRVQTIAHKIVVQHYLNRRDFVPTSYSRINADSDIGQIEYVPPILASDDNRVMISRNGIRLLSSETASQSLYKEFSRYTTATVESVNSSEDIKHPPDPFDALTLQQACSKLFGWSASRTMAIADKVRLKGFISYVRTDDSKLPTSYLDGQIESIIDVATQLNQVGFTSDIIKGYLKSHIPHCFTNDPLDHHGIIPSTAKPAYSDLTPAEYELYELIVRRFLMALLPPIKTLKTQVALSLPVKDLNGHNKCTFRASYSKVIDQGFNVMKERVLDSVEMEEPRVGQQILIGNLTLSHKMTKPDSPLKLPELLEQMRSPKILTSDKTAIKLIKQARGIGTAATRHHAVEKIMKRDYSSEHSDGSILPTQFGLSYFATLDPRLADVNITARLEQELMEIQNARTAEEAVSIRNDVLEKAKGFIEHHVQIALEKV